MYEDTRKWLVTELTTDFFPGSAGEGNFSKLLTRLEPLFSDK